MSLGLSLAYALCPLPVYAQRTLPAPARAAERGEVEYSQAGRTLVLLPFPSAGTSPTLSPQFSSHRTLLPLSSPPPHSSSQPPPPGQPWTDERTNRRPDDARVDLHRSCDMAAISTLGARASLNPTTTDHDWRFPRRPDNDNADSGAGAMIAELTEGNGTASATSAAATGVAHGSSSTTGSSSSKTRIGGSASNRSPAALRDTVKQLRFDLSDTMAAAKGTLSKSPALPGFSDGIAGMSSSPEEQAKEDPLAMQVWRLFAKTKQSLPNQERMENLTWRMMHANLKKQDQNGEGSQNRYASVMHCRLAKKPLPTANYFPSIFLCS